MHSISLPHEPGTLRRYPDFASKHVAARHVDVWLPPGYEDDLAARFPVLYMHDGQNIFEPETSYTGIDWGVDEALIRLMEKDKTCAAIIVGIWNTSKRFEEYMPQKPFLTPRGVSVKKSLAPKDRRVLLSDKYLTFITQELKPFIDRTYRTHATADHTYIMGSSMGGLISAYAVCEYPDVFSGAGCVSTHWPAGDGIMADYLQKALPDPQTHRFYFDYGTETLDAEYEAHQRRVDEIFRTAGYQEGETFISRKFPGADHSEKAWRARVEIPLRFLLKTNA